MFGNLFSPTCLINSIKHEHLCKTLYLLIGIAEKEEAAGGTDNGEKGRRW